jgi:hypothetical protein
MSAPYIDFNSHIGQAIYFEEGRVNHLPLKIQSALIRTWRHGAPALPIYY